MNPLYATMPATIFEHMSARARATGAINLGQGFPDSNGPEDVVEAAARALVERSNQYPPMAGLPELREATELTHFNPLITSLFGHALIATEDPKNFPEAEKVLRSAIAKDNQNPFAWYQLGIIYDRKGDQARAALATAERYNLEGNAQLAYMNAKMAMAGIPRGSPDWVRAQDIYMVSEPELKKKKKDRGDSDQ